MEPVLNIDILEETYNSLPPCFKSALDIKDGSLNVTGWQQFKGRYYDRPLAYDNTPEGQQAAKTRFIEIAYDNYLIIEQMRHYQQLISKLGDFNEWKLSTLTVGAGSSKNQGNSYSLSNGRDVGEDKADTNTRTTLSDSNSFGTVVPGTLKLTEGITTVKCPETGTIQEDPVYYPVNALNQAGTLTRGNRQTNTSSVGASVSDAVNIYENASKVESSNSSEDYRAYLSLRLPELRNRFWSKFNVLFIWLI